MRLAVSMTEDRGRRAVRVLCRTRRVASASAAAATRSSMSRRLLTAWLMLVRLALKETLVPSGRTSSRMTNDPCAWIIGDFADVLGGVAVGGGGAIRMAIPSSARP